ncbi:MAG: hypothetical protein M3R38_06935 [Actinomycetota bacterium]|nr:hypothetical protein [Actinomycetota bacterium]
MSDAAEPAPLIIGLTCRSCGNGLPSAFSRERLLLVKTEYAVLLGGRWVECDRRTDLEAGERIVCLKCGAANPAQDVFGLPPNAPDAESNRHLIAQALTEAASLSCAARDHAATGKSRPAADAVRALRELSDRLTHILAEGDDAGIPQPALRSARARLEETLIATTAECRALRRSPAPVSAGTRT